MTDIPPHPPIESLNSFHLAGIIPLSGQDPTDFGMDWHSSLMPIEANYTLIEAAIYEAAMAGCETIWLAVDEDVTPLIRHRIGEYIIDPVTTKNTDRPHTKEKWIPIYYVPTKEFDEDRRDSLSYGVFHVADVAATICNALSSYVAPDRYYITFPYGLLDPMRDIRPQRTNISSYRKKPVFRYKGKSVFDGEYMPFVMDPKDISLCREDVWLKQTGLRDTSAPKEKWIQTPDNMPDMPPKLPASEQYTARWFGPGEVFAEIDKKNIDFVDLKWYYDVTSFRGYVDFMSSDNYLRRPDDIKLKYKEWNPMSFEEEY